MDFPDFLANEEPLLAGCTPVFSGARILDRPPHGIVLALANIMTRLPIQSPTRRRNVPHLQVLYFDVFPPTEIGIAIRDFR